MKEKNKGLLNFYKYNIVLMAIFTLLGIGVAYIFIVVNSNISKNLSIIYMFSGAFLGLLMISVALGCYYIDRKDELILNISDNEFIFKTPFHKKYFLYASKELKNLRSIVILSSFLALMLVAKKITLPSGFGDLGISFSYIFFAAGTAVFGPFAGMLLGGLNDVLGYYLVDAPSYPFNPLYTVSAIVSGIVYAVFFYRTKITFTKVFYARFIINILINGIWGSFLSMIDRNLNFEQTIVYAITIALPKNIIFLLPQSIVLYLVFKSMAHFFKAANLIDEEICDNINIF